VSSILKALRKLEEEKSRSREGTPDIARDILKRGPRRKAFPWMTFASVAVLVLAFALTGYILMGKSEFQEPPQTQAIHEMPPAQSPAPAVSSSEQKNVLQPVSAPAPPTVAARKTPTKIPAGPALSAEPKAAPEPVRTAPAPRPAAKEIVDPLPALTLTGIAFQEDRESRLAVINDLPVMEGTVIAGARVVEISEDRVRFNYSGRSFEVLLDGPVSAR
jgi:general secretion pathway protein B